MWRMSKQVYKGKDNKGKYDLRGTKNFLISTGAETDLLFQIGSSNPLNWNLHLLYNDKVLFLLADPFSLRRET